MLCVDASTTETTTQRAGIEFALPVKRFEWLAEGWFNPTVLDLAPNDSIHLIRFLSGEDLRIAARIARNGGGLLLAGIVAKDVDGRPKVANSSATIAPGVWRRWRLHLLRIGTRESSAVLSLDEDDKMEEQTRLNWDSTASEPTVLRAGIGFLSAGAQATVLTDELRVSESYAG
jgi:hypothetical protein